MEPLEPFFPFTRAARDNGHFIDFLHGFRPTLATKPEARGWYCFDVTFLSRTQIVITTFGMRDMCWGGIGEKEGEFAFTVDPALTERYVNHRARLLAEWRRAYELEQAEQALLDRYAAEALEGIA